LNPSKEGSILFAFEQIQVSALFPKLSFIPGNLLSKSRENPSACPRVEPPFNILPKPNIIDNIN
jgi:hypothetical protein